MATPYNMVAREEMLMAATESRHDPVKRNKLQLTCTNPYEANFKP
jgi:hypothetical protein